VSPAKGPRKKPAAVDSTEEFERALEKRKSEHYVLRLYIAGNTVRSQTAVENVKKICEENLKGRYDLEVIDIYQDHSKNPVDLVLAAPMLVKKLPLPLRRIIGDMTRRDRLLVGLDLIQNT